MKKARILSLILLIPVLCRGAGPAQGQDPETRAASEAPAPAKPGAKVQFPLEVSFINHAVTMPFDGIVLSPLHPGFSLGTEYAWKEGRLGRLYQSFHSGYFYNEFNAKALFLQTEIGFRHTFRFGLFADVEAGVGYLHAFHPREIFRLNADGEFVKAKDGGKPAAIFSVALGVGYDFTRMLGRPVSVFLRFQPFIQTPYCPEDSIAPQSFVHFGVRFKLW